jgi:uncharacterized protein (TIGR01244 family)
VTPFACSRTAAAILIATALAATAAAQSPPAGIRNFGQVNATYYRGEQPVPAEYAELAALGIKTVINLNRDADVREQRLVEQAGMAYLRIPMTTHVPPTPDQIAQFLGAVTAVAGQPVYVHCVGGRHRTGVMTAVYRMTFDGWTAAQAFAEMKRYRYGADFLRPEFKKFVFAFTPRPPATPASVPFGTAGSAPGW